MTLRLARLTVWMTCLGLACAQTMHGQRLNSAIARSPQDLEGLRRRSRLLEVPRARSDHQGERQSAAGRLDLSDRRQRRLRLQPDHRRRRDVRAGEEQLAGRVECGDGAGDLDPREPARHRAARRELLGEQGSLGAPHPVPDEQLPAGDRRAHGQVDPRLRQERAGRSAGRPRARGRERRARAVEHAREDLRQLDPARRRAGRSPTSRRPAICAPTTCGPARWCGRSTPCRSPANTATTPGRKTPTNTSAAPTRGARSRSTISAASRSSRPDRRPTTTTAPIASAAICSATACSRSTRGRASACGTSRSCTTICGTTI